MILSFKPQFKEPILSGTKIHTFRLDPSDRWKKGRHIHHATGVRSKKYECFKENDCKSVQRVFMTYAFNDVIEITIDGRYIHSHQEKEQIAFNDGFDSYSSFFNWFYTEISKSPEKEFSGKIIHWTDFRY